MKGNSSMAKLEGATAVPGSQRQSLENADTTSIRKSSSVAASLNVMRREVEGNVASPGDPEKKSITVSDGSQGDSLRKVDTVSSGSLRLVSRMRELGLTQSEESDTNGEAIFSRDVPGSSASSDVQERVTHPSRISREALVNVFQSLYDAPGDSSHSEADKDQHNNDGASRETREERFNQVLALLDQGYFSQQNLAMRRDTPQTGSRAEGWYDSIQRVAMKSGEWLLTPSVDAPEAREFVPGSGYRAYAEHIWNEVQRGATTRLGTAVLNSMFPSVVATQQWNRRRYPDLDEK